MICRILRAWMELARSQPKVGFSRKIAPLGAIQTLERRWLMAADSGLPPEAGVEALRMLFPQDAHVGQLAMPVHIFEMNGESASLLDLWIDWDGDGSWNGSDEHVASRLAVTGGQVVVTVDIPGWANSGSIAVRARLSNLTAAPATELVTRFDLLPPHASPGEFGVANVVDAGAAVQIAGAVDLDRDGDMDLLSATFFGSGIIAWYENDGHQNFSRHELTATAEDATGILAVDLNGDGYLDLVSSSLGTSTIAWYQNDGHQNFTAHVITNSASKASGISTADMDGDGDYDLLACSKGDDTVAWYENGGETGFVQHVVSIGLQALCAISAADFDGDGDLDIVAAAFLDNSITWYENDGLQHFATVHTVTDLASGIRGITVGDIDRDGDQDIAASSLQGNSIELYLNDGHGAFARTVVSSDAPLACAIDMADLDGDGDLDLVAGSRGDRTIAWFENAGGTVFSRHNITTSEDQSRGVLAADVDGDGDLDVISASKFGNRLAWYENRPHPKYLTATFESLASNIISNPINAMTLTFSSPVENLNADAFHVVNGHVTELTGSGLTYTLTIKAADEGEVLVELPAGSVADSDGTLNKVATFTRQFTRVLPSLSVTDQAAEFVRRGSPVNVAADIVVQGSRIGGGRIDLIVPYRNLTLARRDSIDEAPLNSLGTCVRAFKSGRLIMSVNLAQTSTAEEVQTALRSLTFSTSKGGGKHATRNIELRLTDNSGQSQSLTRTIQIQRASPRPQQPAVRKVNPKTHNRYPH